MVHAAKTNKGIQEDPDSDDTITEDEGDTDDVTTVSSSKPKDTTAAAETTSDDLDSDPTEDDTKIVAIIAHRLLRGRPQFRVVWDKSGATHYANKIDVKRDAGYY